MIFTRMTARAGPDPTSPPAEPQTEDTFWFLNLLQIKYALTGSSALYNSDCDGEQTESIYLRSS